MCAGVGEGGMVGIDRSIECARACEAKRKRGAEGDDLRSVFRKSPTPRARAFVHLGLLGAARTAARSRRRAACVRNGVDGEKVR